MDKVVNREIKILINRKESEEAIAGIKGQMDKLQNSVDNARNSTERMNEVYGKIGKNKDEINKLNGEIEDLNKQAKEMQKQGLNVDDTLGRIASKKVGIQLLTDEMATFKKEAQAVQKDLAHLSENESRLDKLSDRWRLLSNQLKGTVEPSLNQVKNTMQQLRNEINNLNGGDDKSSKIAQLRLVEAEYGRMKKEIDGVDIAEKNLVEQSTSRWTKWKDIAVGVIVGNTVQSALQTLGGYISGIVSGNSKLSDSLADIQRVTGMTAEEVKKLNTELGKLDTRTSTEGLRNIAVIAGKLGIAKNDVLDFVKATDKLTVALGSELGNADQITTDLGRIINVYSKDGKVTGDAMMYIGNAIVHMANAGTASGDFIVDFTQRLSGLATSAHLSLPEVMGLGAGLQETGQKAESSSTAIIKVLGKIATDVPKFASVAGQSVEDFSNTLATKPVEALIKVSEGLAAGRGSFEEIAKAFKDAGEDGARMISTLGVIGGKSDFFRKKIEDAAIALAKQNEITDAFSLKNETLGAGVEKLGKIFVKVFQSSLLSDFFKFSVGKLTELLLILQKLPIALKENYTLIMALATVTLAYYGNLIKTTIATVAQTFATQQSNIATKASAAWEAIMIAYMGTRITLTQLLTGQITLATAAQRMWNLTMAANPIGAIILLLGALATATTLAYNNTKEAIEYERLRLEISEGVIKANDKLAASQKLYNAQIQNYSRLSLIERNDLQKNIDLKLTDAEATLAQLKAKEQLAAKDAARPTLFQFAKNIAMNGANVAGAQMANATDAADNSLAATKEMDEQIKTLEESINKLKDSKQQLVEITQSETTADKMQGLTTAQLNEKLKLYQVALDNAVKGGEDYLRIQKKIAQVESKIQSSHSIVPSEDELKKAKSEYESITNDILKIAKSGTQSQLDEVEHRYSELNKRLDLWVKNIKEHQVLEQKLEKEHQAEIDKILADAKKKHYEQLVKEAEQESMLIMQNELKLLMELNKHDVENQTDIEKAKERLEMEHLQRMIKAYDFFGMDASELKKKYSELEVKQFKNAEDAKIAAAKKANEAIDKADEKAIDRKIKRWKSFFKIAEFGMQGLNKLNNIIDNSEQTKYNNSQSRTKKEIAALDDKLAKGLISQEAHDAKVIQLNTDLENQKKEIEIAGAKRAKAIAEFQIAISTAQAIMNVWSEANPFKGFGVRMAESIIVGSIGALEAVAAATAPLPTFEDGGFISGRSHKEGGVNINAEGGEVMGSRKFVSNNPTMANAIADASRNNSGVLPKWYSDPVRSFNYNNAMSAVNWSKHGTPNYSTPQTSEGGTNAALLMEIKEMKQAMINWPKHMKAYLVYQDKQIEEDRIGRIKDDAKLS